MPIYEYKCGACGEQTDALQKIADAPLTDCPSCGESALRRLISAPSFRLKGAGWYETDFKAEGDKKRNLAESDSKPAEKPADKPAAAADSKTSKTESKSDSKPAAKKEEKKPAAVKAADTKSAD